MFCRDHVVQLRDRYGEFEARGAVVASIGMGSVAQANAFATRYEIPFPLLVDHDKLSYRALQLKRGDTMEVAGPGVWAAGLKTILRGRTQSLNIKQDPLQLGGSVVVAPGGEILFLHRAATSADNAPMEDLLAALP
jgi:hypothetical protein